MKMILGFLLGLASVSAFAEETNIEITSFVMAGTRTRAAELCGKVTGLTKPIAIVKVTVDPNTDRPGIYNVIASQEGRFCTTVVSYSGEAEASIRSDSGKEVTSSMTNLATQVSR